MRRFATGILVAALWALPVIAADFAPEMHVAAQEDAETKKTKGMDGNTHGGRRQCGEGR